MIEHHRLRGAASDRVIAAARRALRRATGRKHRFVLIVYPGFGVEEGDLVETAFMCSASDLASPSGAASVLRLISTKTGNEHAKLRHSGVKGAPGYRIGEAIDLAIVTETAGAQLPFALIVLPDREGGEMGLVTNSPDLETPAGLQNICGVLASIANSKPTMN